MHDVVIKGGLVVDGSGGEPFVADVAVTDGRVADIGRRLGASRRNIDAIGHIVSPGFIDIHTHSDFTLPVRPGGEAKLLQGVTTDCTGNCGFSPFPFRSVDASSRSHGSFFEPALDMRWPTLSAFAEEIDGLRPGINLAPLVGLGAIRLAVLGDDHRSPTDRELLRMQDLLTEALTSGAFGASAGLTYAPSGFADLRELVALTTAVAKHDRLYATHLRDEGGRLDEALEEALITAQRAGCRLQISHLKAFGRSNWGKVKGTLARIDRATDAGVDVAVDVYPYTTACTTLAAALPPRALDGGQNRLKEQLADPLIREQLHALLEDGEKPLDTIVLGALASHPEYAGEKLSVVAHSLNLSPAELLLRLVERDGVQSTMLVDAMSESDVKTVISHPESMFGSDGWTMSTTAMPYAHPRDFAAAVRLLTRYVRDEPLLDLVTAIRKLTALPARRLRLPDRGVIARGYAADICVMDFERLDERASVETPCCHPVGVRHVLVNGVVAVDGGELTHERGGLVLSAS
jgi:N-acyl-D-amino-acid deacylase